MEISGGHNLKCRWLGERLASRGSGNSPWDGDPRSRRVRPIRAKGGPGSGGRAKGRQPFANRAISTLRRVR
jgi:hypothetical protein